MIHDVRLKAELLERVRREPSPTRLQRQRHLRRLGASAAIFMLGVFALAGGARLGSRPGALVLGGVIGWAAVSALAVAACVAPRRSMLGPPAGRLSALVVAAPLLTFGWMLLLNVLFPETLTPVPGRPGFRCLALTLTLAAWPVAALGLARRGTALDHPGLRGAALGVTAAACAGVLVQLYCPIAAPVHTALGHISPFLILAAAGWAVGRRLLDPAAD